MKGRTKNMKMRKKTKMTISTVLSILLLFCSFSFASEALSDKMYSHTNCDYSFTEETLEKSYQNNSDSDVSLVETNYSSQALSTLSRINNSEKLSEMEKVKTIVELILKLKYEQISQPHKSPFDFFAFFEKQNETITKTKEDLFYFCRDIIEKKEIAKTHRIKYNWAYLELSFNDILINNDYAKVSVYAHYKYNTNALPFCEKEELSFSASAIPYEFYLFLNEGNWVVSDIIFEDTSTIALKEKRKSVERLIYNPLHEQTEDMSSTSNSTGILPKSSPNVLMYINPSKVASYAASYYYSYNLKFIYYDEDCQNFASQCLWYGLGGVDSSANVSAGLLPMINGGGRAWYNNGSSASSSWISCTSFGNYIYASGSNTIGPTGSIYSGIQYAKVGDLIQYSKNNDSTYNHVYIVNAVTGTYGSRTPANIFVSAHSSNIYNTPLLSVYKEDYTYRTLHIIGYYDNPNDSYV